MTPCSKVENENLLEKEVKEVPLFKISRLKSKPHDLRITCWLNNDKITGIIDTAADVSIISEKTFKSLSKQPKLKETISMKAAGENQIFTAQETESMKIQIGNNLLFEKIYVAPIHDSMLIGLDILRTLNAKIDLSKNTLTVNEEKIPLSEPEIPWDPGISKDIQVKLKKMVKLPANSEVVLRIKLKEKCNAETCMLEPNPELKQIEIARAIYKNTNHIKISFINMTDHSVKLAAGTQIGTLCPVNAKSADLQCARSVKENISDTLKNDPIDEEILNLLKKADKEMSNNFTEEQQKRAKDIIFQNRNVFAKNDFDLGSFDRIEHSIDTGEATPVKLGLRRTPIQYVKEEDEMIENMLKADVIRPSSSSWAAAPVLVKKKDGKCRMALDYRKLNLFTKKDVFPVPMMSECLDALEGNVIFSKLDSNNAYWQIKVEESSKDKTAFRTRKGLWEFNRLPFGLCNSGSTYMRAMALVLTGLTWESVLCFLDDICVLGKTIDDHLDNLEKVLKRLNENNLKLKPRKCELFLKEIEFLGRKMGPDGVTLCDHSIDTISNWIPPTSIKEIQSFLGFINFHRQFVPQISKIVEPLNRVIKKNKFFWGIEQQCAFDEVKIHLISPEVLAIPTRDGIFTLDVDASQNAIGAELRQNQNGVDRTIAFGSFTLTNTQRKYCTTRKELLAVVRFTNHFRHYLIGQEFEIRSDHHSLVWLYNFRRTEGQMARWLQELSRYNFTLKYRPGIKHVNADALSRRNINENTNCDEYDPTLPLQNLPCGGCRYCSRIHNQWGNFLENVDDTAELGEKETLFKHIPKIRKVNVKPNENRYNLENTWFPNEIKEEISNCDSLKYKGSLDIWHSRDKDSPKINIRNVSVESLELNSIREHQKTDPKLKSLYAWLTNQTEIEEAVLSLADKEEKFYWINKSLFVLRDDVIYFQKDEIPKIVVPLELRKTILELNHCIPLASHQGDVRTKQKIKISYFWFEMSKDIKSFVSGCAKCNQNKKYGTNHSHPLQVIQAGIPLERIHIDFLGPLPTSDSGNNHVLVISDSFTKWVELIPLPSQNAEETAKALVNQFIARLGCPLSILSDQGRNFESDLFKAICELLGIHKYRTTAYRPSVNGQAERVNRTFMQAVRCYVGKKQKDWDIFIPQIAAALRSSVNKQTGFTPNMLMLGREVTSPTELIFPGVKPKEIDTESYVYKLQESMKDAFEIARDTLKTNTKYMKRHHDKKIHKLNFIKGDVIYLLNKKAKKGINSKLLACFEGPMLITEVKSPYVFKVMIKNNKEKIVNHDQIKLCKDTLLPKWILKAKTELDTIGEISHCFCGKPYNGDQMIQCDNCLSWFHTKCLKLSKKEIKNIEIYACSDCIS